MLTESSTNLGRIDEYIISGNLPYTEIKFLVLLSILEETDSHDLVRHDGEQASILVVEAGRME